jgi:hypothetical protein
VHCHVPIKIRLVGRPDPERLSAAVAGAVRRRVAEAARVMAADFHPGYAVTFDWTGAALVDAARSSIESDVATAVDSVATEAKRAKLSRPVDLPAELVDPERDLAPLDSYLVDSYAGGGKPNPMPVKPRTGPVPPPPSIPGFVEAIGTADPNWSDEEWTFQFFEAVDKAGLTLHNSELVGFLYEDAGSYRARLFEVVSVKDEVIQQSQFADQYFGSLTAFDFDDDANLLPKDVRVSATSRMALRPFGDTSTEQARKAIRVELWRAQILKRLRAARARIVHKIGEAAFAQHEREALARASDVSEVPGTRGLMGLIVDGTPFLLETFEIVQLPHGTTIPLVPYRVTVPKRPVSPFPAGTGTTTLVCEAFENEPPLSRLGADSEWLRRLMREIAGQLSMPECEYAGRFAIDAATVLGGRAHEAGTIPLLRRLAGAAPLLSKFCAAFLGVYAKPENAGRNQSYPNSVTWSSRFHDEFTPAISLSAATVFGTACKVLLLGLLTRSAEELQKRRQDDYLDRYAVQFEQVVAPRLRHISELTALRDTLRYIGTSWQAYEHALRSTASAGSVARPTTVEQADRSWRAARANLVIAFGGTGTPQEIGPAKGTIVWGDGRTAARIHDGTGRTWSVAELEREIVSRRALLETIDPLVKQLLELDDVLARFADPKRGVRAELAALLDEMLAHNHDQRRKVEADWIYAFRISHISEDSTAPTVYGTTYNMTGIHLRAHEAIGTAFEGGDLYALGLKYLFDAELGRKELLSFFKLTLIVTLSIVCPPLGTAVGILDAVYQLHEVNEGKDLYRSLLDPEQVLSYAEIEAELFAARLGLVLSFIPEAGNILRGGARFGKDLVTEGVTAAARGAGRSIATGIAKETIKALERNLLAAFVKEMATAYVMQEIASAVLEPIVARIEREAAVTGPVGGVTGLQRMLDEIDREP